MCGFKCPGYSTPCPSFQTRMCLGFAFETLFSEGRWCCLPLISFCCDKTFRLTLQLGRLVVVVGGGLEVLI